MASHPHQAHRLAHSSKSLPAQTTFDREPSDGGIKAYRHSDSTRDAGLIDPSQQLHHKKVPFVSPTLDKVTKSDTHSHSHPKPQPHPDQLRPLHHPDNKIWSTRESFKKELQRIRAPYTEALKQYMFASGPHFFHVEKESSRTESKVSPTQRLTHMQQATAKLHAATPLVIAGLDHATQEWDKERRHLMLLVPKDQPVLGTDQDHFAAWLHADKLKFIQESQRNAVIAQRNNKQQLDRTKSMNPGAILRRTQNRCKNAMHCLIHGQEKRSEFDALKRSNDRIGEAQQLARDITQANRRQD